MSKLGLLLALRSSVGVFAFVADGLAGSSPTTCGVVSVALVNAKLGIDAAHVTAHHPASPAGALICSYYGNSGRATNEATINYVPASPTAFAAVEASLAKTHSEHKITGIQSGAYTYVAEPDRFLYVLDGTTQAQIFATASVSLARLEALGRALPSLF